MKKTVQERYEIFSKPIPKEIDSITLKVVRKNGLWNKVYPIIELQDLSGENFLLNSKKMFKNKTTNFHISASPNQYSKDDEGYCGKIRRRGKAYTLYDNKTDNDSLSEIALIKYEKSKDNPTSTRAFSLDLSENLIEDASPKEETKYDQLEEELACNIFSFKNVDPYFDEDNKCYLIDFTQHTSFINSSKNYQVKWKGKDQLVVEQVKTNKNEYELRFRWPFSILTAFALSVSMFDPKMEI
mmetsp:Transcript_13870/g.12288  ORF Transcript_13870/g.12288 Transcript_13870/m.12288 type:complete len:241 (-) Transcript_13870:42-764(-)